MNSYDDVLKISDEVDKICSYFLKSINIPYFQFKRTYKNQSPIILANNAAFFNELFKDGSIEPRLHFPLNTRQSYFCFWDETLATDQLSNLKQSLGVYHGLTIL